MKRDFENVRSRMQNKKLAVIFHLCALRLQHNVH